MNKHPGGYDDQSNTGDPKKFTQVQCDAAFKY